VVLLNNQHPSEFVYSVMIANVEASIAATQHLIALGHRRIAYIGDRFGHQSDAERLEGYRCALQAARLPLDPQLAVRGDGKPEAAETAMFGLLDLPQPPTAVFCYNDLTALGATRAARRRGLCLPADLSLVGFDDLHISQYFYPALTTIRQPMRKMGRMAMETLLDLISGRRGEQNLKVPGELVVRDSTAPPQERS
jgi:DNA-binding LacI/PurR family transcriptional regulator